MHVIRKPRNDSRFYDVIYDPTYRASTKKDFEKSAIKASLRSAQMDIAPNFLHMFSELPNKFRQSLVLRNTINVSVDLLWEEKQEYQIKNPVVDVSGAERSKFFAIPVITLSPDMIAKINFPKRERKRSSLKTGPQAKGTQTIYRESSAQTKPWKTPHYKVIDNSDPEILKLNFLERNLPPGLQEIEIIKQARRTREWEKLLPLVEGIECLHLRRQMLEAVEIDQWAFREQNINEIQRLRLELLERMVEEILSITANKTVTKLNKKAAELSKERERKMAAMKHRKERELRRLYRQNHNISTKYSKVNIIDEHIDYKSELYAPLMRYGEHPKRGHAVIEQEYEPLLHGIETMSTLPSWLEDNEYVYEHKIKLPGRRLCIRETKWTEPVLKLLHEELSNLNTFTSTKCTLRKRKEKQVVLDETARVSTMHDLELEEFKAALVLQNIIRGRSTQTLIYEGRDRCRELIQELQSTHALVMAHSQEKQKKRMEVLNQQRNVEIQLITEANMEEVFNQLQGTTVGTMLDFLNKELVRILDERKAHAIALVYERERRECEAAEAGRRQAEERRRREHDEMFKQVVRVHQDTVDLYLRDIIVEGIDLISEEDAENYVKQLTEQIKEEEKEEPKQYLEREELIADMVCQFVIPEVEKQKIRKKITDKQKKYLRCAHEAIYNKIEHLPKITDYECRNEYLDMYNSQYDTSINETESLGEKMSEEVEEKSDSNNY